MNVETLQGEVYKIIVTRVQEQEVEVEIFDDGEELDSVIWDVASNDGWVTVNREIESYVRITCAGEV
jgi:hypothetical protein